MNKPPSLNPSKKRREEKRNQSKLHPLSLSIFHLTMDSSTPSTPISHHPKPRFHPTKADDPIDSPAPVRSPLRELLLLSPSPYRKSRPRPRPLIVDECADAVAQAAAVTPCSRKKGKSRASGASPRNARRARRRPEKETVTEVLPFEEEGVRARRKRPSKARVRSEEGLALVAWAPPLSPSPRICKEEIANVESWRNGDWPWELIVELVMWQNTAKSLLWFGLGTMLFFSSCFSKDVSFSMISALAHLGLLILGLAFLRDSFPQRQEQKPKAENFKLKEEDILRVTRLILPMVNAALAKSQEVFSGEPLMTLKVAPILVFTAKYGHLITPCRLLATGFFLGFTLPKFYSCYSDKILRKVEETRSYVWESWKSYPRKRFIAASAAMVLWNLFSVKMRVFAAFISLVALRHHHQQQIGSDGVENENREAALQQKGSETAEK